MKAPFAMRDEESARIDSVAALPYNIFIITEFGRGRKKLSGLRGSSVLRNYLPLFYIWGLVEAAGAAAEVFWVWTYPDWLRPALFIAALLLSLAVLFNARQKDAVPVDSSPFAVSPVLFVPAAVCAAALLLLWHIGAFGPAVAAVLRAIALSLLYTVFGAVSERRLLYLGLWLFALTAYISLAYIGFAPVVLSFFGGASLIACGWILRSRITA
jgi:hypothetical protein